MANMATARESAMKLKMFVVACTVVAALLIRFGVPVLPVAAGLMLAGFMTWRRWAKL